MMLCIFVYLVIFIWIPGFLNSTLLGAGFFTVGNHDLGSWVSSVALSWQVARFLLSLHCASQYIGFFHGPVLLIVQRQCTGTFKYHTFMITFRYWGGGDTHLFLIIILIKENPFQMVSSTIADFF